MTNGGKGLLKAWSPHYPGPELPMRSAEDILGMVSELSFSLSPLLHLPFLPGVDPENILINTLHDRLHLRVCLPMSPIHDVRAGRT